LSIPKHISLSDLASIISDSIDATFIDRPIWVIAETSDIKNYYDRSYCFLTLVEKEGAKIKAKLEAVIWRNTYHIIQEFETITRIKFEKNINLLMLVNVTFSNQYGLKLNVIKIDASYTVGNLELERKRILEKLVNENQSIIKFDGENYFTFNQQLKLPAVIRDIALITAPNSDGQRDFVHELENNNYNYHFQIEQYVTQIQGSYASESILNQLKLIKNSSKKFDVIVIARGGGSQTDFTAFENYNLAQIIAGFETPILTGIGHERNVSIADLMSNKALKTPTKVANFIIENNKNFEHYLITTYQEIIANAQYQINIEKSNLGDWKKTIYDSSYKLIDKQKHELEKYKLSMKLLSPQNVLARGFAIISHQNNIIINGSELVNNDKVKIQFLNETIDATINI